MSLNALQSAVRKLAFGELLSANEAAEARRSGYAENLRLESRVRVPMPLPDRSSAA